MPTSRKPRPKVNAAKVVKRDKSTGRWFYLNRARILIFGLCSIAASAFAYWSDFKIALAAEPFISLDPKGQYAANIKITNDGWVSAYNLRFGCGYGYGVGITRVDGVLSPATLNLTAVPVLGHRETVTRSCNTPLSVEGNSRLVMIVKYEWPWLGIPIEERFAFSVAEGPLGYQLVPDVAPFDGPISVSISPL